MISRKPRTSKDQIFGCVIHIDNYGNAITNITKEIFEQVGENKSYTITTFSRDQFDTLAETYQDVDKGETMAIFNSAGLLEICIRQGKASQLLGMNYETPVTVSFL